MLEIVTHCTADRGIKTCISERFVKTVLPQPVFDRAFQFGEAKADAKGSQPALEVLQHVGGGDIDVGHRLGGDHNSPGRLFGGRHGGQQAAAKNLSVGKEQRRVPSKQHEARRLMGLWVTADVVITLPPWQPAQHSRIRLPSPPDEFTDGQQNSKANARDNANEDDPSQADK